jgi:RNA polymerase sigma factor (sigma-70 family)
MLNLPDYTPLGAADEVALANRIEAGVYAAALLEQRVRRVGVSPDDLRALAEDGERAKQEFFLANLRLVAAIAHRWCLQYALEFDDLFQEGCVALGEAILAWDCRRGTRFASYAWHRVTGRVRESCAARCGGLEMPAWWLKERARALSRCGETVTREEIAGLARWLGRSQAWVREALAWAPPRPLWAGDDVPDESPDPLPRACVAALRGLPADEEEVLRLRYGVDCAPQPTRRVSRALGRPVRDIETLESSARRRLGAILADLPMAA